jgi:hypothetical protein
MKTDPPPMLRAPLIALASCILLAAGCGRARDGALTGRVSYKGKPLAMGALMFVIDDDKAVTARIREDGTYEAKDLWRGTYKVSVRSDDPRIAATYSLAGMMARAAKAKVSKAEMRKKIGKPMREGEDSGSMEVPLLDVPAAKKWFAIPGRYADPTKSGLTCEIHQGANVYNIELE